MDKSEVVRHLRERIPCNGGGGGKKHELLWSSNYPPLPHMMVMMAILLLQDLLPTRLMACSPELLSIFSGHEGKWQKTNRSSAKDGRTWPALWNLPRQHFLTSSSPSLD